MSLWIEHVFGQTGTLRSAVRLSENIIAVS